MRLTRWQFGQCLFISGFSTAAAIASVADHEVGWVLVMAPLAAVGALLAFLSTP